MKRKYIKPQVEIYSYCAEQGYAGSVALYKDILLIEGDDRSTLRASEQITEYTDAQGEYEIGLWEL